MIFFCGGGEEGGRKGEGFTVGTICARDSGPSADVRLAKKLRPHWPFVRFVPGGGRGARRAHSAPGGSFALRQPRFQPWRSNYPGSTFQECGVPPRVCPCPWMTHRLLIKQHHSSVETREGVLIALDLTELLAIQGSDTSAEESLKESCFGWLRHFASDVQLADQIRQSGPSGANQRHQPYNVSNANIIAVISSNDGCRILNLTHFCQN